MLHLGTEHDHIAQAETTPKDGSWWLEWASWLNQGTTIQVKLPPIGTPGFEPICDAPGQYVLQR